jgi:phosphohistidine phosphatase
MRLYLVQHAQSKRKEEDPSKPLSTKGWQDIRRVSRYAEKRLRIQVAQILQSGKLRAKQTAEVLTEHLHPAQGVAVADGLDPLADPTMWAARLAEATESIMLVGHLPHLSKLAAQLLTGDTSREIVAFRNGGIVCLEKEENGSWAIRWAITPEIIPQE